MHRFKAVAIVSAGLSLTIASGLAATPTIGVATTQGSFLLNDTQTPGNANVFDGATLQTGKTPSQVNLLKSGAWVRFESDSRGKLFSDHVDLQQGSARIRDYAAVANGLSVHADSDSSASVTMKGKVVEVAALTGNVHVFNATGINVANLLPGHALDLLPAEVASNQPSTLTGCAVKTGNALTLTDEASAVTVQLRGGDLKVGERVQVTGSMVPARGKDATQAIEVSGVKAIGGRCAPVVSSALRQQAGATAPDNSKDNNSKKKGAGAATGGATAGGAGAAAGVSTGVIVGVSVAAAAGVAVGAAYGTGAIGGSTPCVPTSSQPCPS